MRIGAVRAAWPGELGEIDLALQPGIVGWSGGSSRDRRLFSDLLRSTLGLVPPDTYPPGHREGPEPDMAPVRGSVEVVLNGEVLVQKGEPTPPTGRGAARRTEPELWETLGLDREELVLAWEGGGGTEPEMLWRSAARLLARREGGDLLDRVVVRLGGAPRTDSFAGYSEAGRRPALGSPHRGALGPDEPEEVGSGEKRLRELPSVERRLRELEDVPAKLRAQEELLRGLRADAAEVSGDLEVASMEWLREQQDAETQLQTYRDRARELRSRMEKMEEAGPDSPCPFCGRLLEDQVDRVTSELEDEWERLVQDGSWWKKRRDQLRQKPEGLQELERRAVRLQAAVERCAEELERFRFDLREWDELRGRREELRIEGGTGDAPRSRDYAAGRRSTLRHAFEGAREALLGECEDRLVRSAGTLLNRISGGRILGMRGDRRSLGLLEDGREIVGPSQEDRAAATLSFHLALALELVGSGVPLQSILVGEVMGSMEPDARQRAVEALRELRDRLPQILVLAGTGLVDAMPERFDWILDFRSHRIPRSLKLVRGGVGGLELEGC